MSSSNFRINCKTQKPISLGIRNLNRKIEMYFHSTYVRFFWKPNTTPSPFPHGHIQSQTRSSLHSSSWIKYYPHIVTILITLPQGLSQSGNSLHSLSQGSKSPGEEVKKWGSCSRWELILIMQIHANCIIMPITYNYDSY